MNSIQEKEVGVIAAFSTQGKIKPLYFNAMDEDGGFTPMKVYVLEEAEYHPLNYPYTLFKCSYVYNGVERRVVLKYSHNLHTWYKKASFN